jgi:CheY-like chemotaxis protein
MIHNLLLIDDSDIDNYVAESLLKKNNVAAQLTTKLSGRDALDYLNELIKHKTPFPEIILLDINMPLMDGFAFLDKYKDFPKHVTAGSSIIMLTSSNNKADEERARKTGMVLDYFVKPFTHAQVKKMMEHYEEVGHRK